jgi:predicted TPR repeat methyltransferase
MVDKQQILLLYHLQGVEELFDEYAETFDTHLQQGLRYDVPNLMRQHVSSAVSTDDTCHFKRCLDLGCGTGLGGVAFRDCCDYLEGVDLSLKMVKKARALKNEYGAVLYNVAKHGDLHGYLKKKKKASFDLMISVDVVMYIYDLAPLFKEVKRVLSIDGIFAVSTEALDEDEAGDDGVLERETCRYAHSRTHVLALAEDGLELQCVENVLGRMDEGNEIRSDIYVFKRVASS